MSVPISVVDAFTDTAFRGNPAAVCQLETPGPDDWMQSVAAEMNLSETAFLLPAGDAWSLRWFSPSVEIDLCGHATLASAFVLMTETTSPPLARNESIMCSAAIVLAPISPHRSLVMRALSICWGSKRRTTRG
jgi:PhzF family phenazine biosynthesis protein